MYVKETKCSSCSHCPICSIRDEYLRLVESIPKQVNSNFKVNVDCNFFTASYNALYNGTIKGTAITNGTCTDASRVNVVTSNIDTSLY